MKGAYMNQYIYRIRPQGYKRTKTIALYGDAEPLVIGHQYLGGCVGAYNQHSHFYTALALETVRECG